MKTYDVAVTYQDAQFGEPTHELEQTYTIQADNENDACCLAMTKCARELHSHEPIEAIAIEFCTTCQNTGYEPGQEGGLCPDCNTKPAHIPQTRQAKAA